MGSCQDMTITLVFKNKINQYVSLCGYDIKTKMPLYGDIVNNIEMCVSNCNIGLFPNELYICE